jgi:exosortase
MTETMVQSQTFDSDAAPAMTRRRRWTIALILASILPLFALHLRHLWAKPHYQFYPLLLLGVAGLVWMRWGQEDAETGGPLPEGSEQAAEGGAPQTGASQTAGRFGSLLGLALLLLGMTVLAAGIVLFSPWVAAVAALLTMGGLILRLTGAAAWRRWLPLWAVLWLLIPPPMAWDEEAVTRLQLVASRVSSLTLDVMGIGHVMEGNVLVLPECRLLVEEACSGINSLFSLLAVTALFVVAVRRPLIWSLLLLASSAAWAGVMNAARVVTVAVAFATQGWNLSSGWPHELLGVATVGLAVVMVICTDRVLAFFLGPIVPADPQHALNPLSRAWNWCLGWRDFAGLPGSLVDDDLEAGDHLEAGDLAAGDGAQPSASRAAVAPRAAATAGLRQVPLWIVVGFVLLGLLQVVGLAAAFYPSPQRWADSQRLGQAGLFDESDLPAAMDGWTRSEFKTEEGQGVWGDYRQLWTYRSELGDALISVAYPFRGWHDLRACYRGAGWRVVSGGEQSTDAAGASLVPYLEAQMRGPGGEYGVLFFSLVDQAGRPIDSPRRVTWRILAARVARNPLANFAPQSSQFGEQAAFQVQVLVASEDVLSAAQQQAARDLFMAARQTLVSVYHQQRQVGHE